MEVSPNTLRKETVQLLNQINEMIEAVEAMVSSASIEFLKEVELMGSLLSTKAQCIHTLTLLSVQGAKR